MPSRRSQKRRRKGLKVPHGQKSFSSHGAFASLIRTMANLDGLAEPGLAAICLGRSVGDALDEVAL